MPLFMVGQNIQSKHSELRAEHDYQTDKKAEKEIETILLHLENQEKILLDLQNGLKIWDTNRWRWSIDSKIYKRLMMP